MQGIPHHLMGFLELGKGFSLAEYQKLAYEKITNILNRKKIPILVGGTGLYLRAVLEDYKLSEAPPDQKFRDEMKKRAEIEGKESLYNELRELDIEASKKIHPNNRKKSNSCPGGNQKHRETFFRLLQQRNRTPFKH